MVRWSDYPGESKMRNVSGQSDTRARRDIDGQSVKFASIAEARRYDELRLMELAGAITNLVLQPRYILQKAFTSNEGEKVPAITYTADFRYLEEGQVIVEDVKGRQTDASRLRQKLFMKRYPECHFRLVDAAQYHRRSWTRGRKRRKR